MSTVSYAPVGYMPMPAGFTFKNLFEQGRPRHDRNDPFRVRHPQMPLSRRAKIFAPFDALRGFKDQIVLKEKENENVYTVLHRARVGGFIRADGDGSEDEAGGEVYLVGK